MPACRLFKPFISLRFAGNTTKNANVGHTSWSAHPTLGQHRDVQRQTRYMNTGAESSETPKSPSDKSPVACYPPYTPPPPLSLLTSPLTFNIIPQHHPHPQQHHNTKARSLCQTCILFYLYVCLSLSSSHCLMFHWNKMLIPSLPPCFSLSLSLSRLSLCRVSFSNTKPPLGVESVNGARAAQGVAQ